MAAAVDDLEKGRVLAGRYEILQLLGRGGMGAVYKARDTELDRVVALKLIRPELAMNPEILKRFKQGLILARQVTHKNVIRIFDLGQSEGIKFITMDFVEGQNLRDLLLERGKFPSEQAARSMLQICRALEAAHAEGVIHRDPGWYLASCTWGHFPLWTSLVASAASESRALRASIPIVHNLGRQWKG